MERNRTKVSHLQIVDDTILFSRACTKDLQNFKLIQLNFMSISRLKINLHKSILLRIKRSRDQIIRLGSLLKCQVSKKPLTYDSQ